MEFFETSEIWVNKNVDYFLAMLLMYIYLFVSYFFSAGLISTSQLYDLIKRRYKREWGRVYYHPSGSSGSSNVNKWAFFDALSFLHSHVEDSSR